MKKMENFFRRVLAMVLCISMLMGNMGGALADGSSAVFSTREATGIEPGLYGDTTITVQRIENEGAPAYVQQSGNVPFSIGVMQDDGSILYSTTPSGSNGSYTANLQNVPGTPVIVVNNRAYKDGDTVRIDMNGNNTTSDATDAFVVSIKQGEQNGVYEGNPTYNLNVSLVNHVQTQQVTVKIDNGNLSLAKTENVLFAVMMGADDKAVSEVVPLQYDNNTKQFTGKLTAAADAAGSVRLLTLKNGQSYNQNDKSYNTNRYELWKDKGYAYLKTEVNDHQPGYRYATDFYQAIYGENNVITLKNNDEIGYTGMNIYFTGGDLQVNTGNYNGFSNTGIEPGHSLGLAGNFHLVAFDTAYLNVHTNGNVLAKKVDSTGYLSNFGTNVQDGINIKETHYIQDYHSVNGGSSQGSDDILALGKETVLAINDRGDEIFVMDAKMGPGKIDRPDNFIIDVGSGEFISLSDVESKIRGISSDLASHRSNSGISEENLDSNRGGLRLTTDKGAGFYNINIEDLRNLPSSFRLMFGDNTNNGTIVINVHGTGTAYMPNEAMVMINGETQGTSEVTKFNNGKVIWNFIDATTVETGQMTGIIIAPNATVNLNSNVNGTVVAKNIYVKAESHRTDFYGTLTPAEVSIQVKKVGEKDVALSGVTFELRDANNQLIATLTTGSDGTLTFTGLTGTSPYTLEEVKAAPGYESNEGKTVVVNVTDGKAVSVTKEPGSLDATLENDIVKVKNTTGGPGSDKISITAEKVWNEVECGSEKRQPTTFHLWQIIDGNETELVDKKITVPIENFTYTWTDLPTKTNDKPAQIITYKVTEDSVPEYTTSVEKSGYTYTFTNTRQIVKTVTVNGSKTWVNDTEDKRPDKLVIILNANKGNTSTLNIQRVEVSEAQGWEWEFTNLPMTYLDDNGVEQDIQYYVTEQRIPGYSTTYHDYDGDTDGKGMNVTNTYDNETKEIPVEKVWVGEAPADASVTINLYEQINGVDSQEPVDTVTLTNGNWKHTFTNLPKYKKGYEVVYFVVEEPVEGYGSVVTGDQNKYIITNTPVVKIEVQKEWKGAGNDQNRPGSVHIELRRNVGGSNDEYVNSVDITAGTNWKHTFTETYDQKPLAMYDANGASYNYTISEVVPYGFEANISYPTNLDDGNTLKFVVTNTKIPVKQLFSFTKEWVFTDAEYDKIAASLPDKVYAEIWAVSATTKDHKVQNIEFVRHANQWWHAKVQLPVEDDQGNAYTYYLKNETPVEGFITTYKDNNKVIRNTPADNVVSVKVKKIWDDEDPNKRPNINQVEFQLWRIGDQTPLVSAFLKDFDEKLEYTFTTLKDNETLLPKYDSNGNEYEYYVKEVIPEYAWLHDYSTNPVTVYRYNTELDDDTPNVFIFTNSHGNTKTSVSGSKTWIDDNNSGNTRPGSITIYLNKNVNGTVTEKVETKTVTPVGDTWSWTFDNLPKKESGVTIEYSISEGPVAGYQSQVNGYDVTNTLLTEATVKKVWEDDENRDRLRPESLTVTLSNGTDTVGTVDLNEGNGWEDTITNLPKYDANGTEIIYTWSEPEVADYTRGEPVINGTLTTLTNTHDIEKTSVTVTKVWNDGDANHDSIQVQLKADGENCGEPVTLPDGGKWTYTWNGLPVNKDGMPIEYTVDEVNVPAGYYKEGPTEGDDGFTITNTKIAPASVTFMATKSLDGAALTKDQFTFELKDANDTVLQTKKNDSTGNVTFEAISYDYTQVGNKYTYTITEKNDGQSVYIYDTTKYKVVVDVQLSDGKYVVATPSYYKVEDGKEDAPVDALAFTNTYVAPAIAELEATKTLEGKELGDLEFNFVLVGTDNAPMPAGAIDNQVTVQNDGANIAFGEIEYNLSAFDANETTKTFTYEIYEQPTGSDIYKADSTRYFAAVTVEKGATQIEVKSITYYTKNDDGNEVRQDAVTFVNNYVPKRTELRIPFTKTLNNGDNSDNNIARTFNFALAPVKGNPASSEKDNQIAEVTVDANTTSKEGSFDAISYTKAGTYTYTVTETEGTKADIVYDKTSYTVTVSVVDNNGQLEASISKVEKTVAGGESTNVEDKSIKFENTYIAPIEVSLGAKKALTGKTLTAGEFSFELKKADGAVETKQNETDGTVSFGTIKYTAEDLDDQDSKTFTYTISEVTTNKKDGYKYDEAVYTINVTISKSTDGKSLTRTVICTKTVGDQTTNVEVANPANIVVGFTNEYGTTDVKGSKTWNDENNAYGIRPENITLQLYREKIGAETQDQLINWECKWTNTNTDKWEYAYTGLPKYVQGEEATYYVVEAPVNGYVQTHADKAKDLINNLDTFSISGTKTWTDAENQDGKRPDSIIIHVKADEISFDKTVELRSGENKVWDAAELTWSLSGLPKYNKSGALIEYTVTEELNDTARSDYAVTYKVNGEDAENAKVKYDKDKNSTVDVTNTHKTEEISVKVTKIWTGDTDSSHRPDSIKVQLKNSANNEVQEAVLKSDTWSCEWNNLPKYADGKEIQYTVEETLVGDWIKYYVAGNPVKATDSTEGVLHYNITNTYVGDVEVNLGAIKSVKGKDVIDNIFTFTLNKVEQKEGEAPTETLVDSVKNNGSEVTFKPLTFTKEQEGVYTYSISEETGTTAGYTYSKEKYTAVVTVSFNETTNKLSCDVVYKNAEGEEINKDAVKFENEYNTTGTDIAIPFEKTLENAKELSDTDKRTFTFELYEVKDGNESRIDSQTLAFAAADADSETGDATRSGSFKAINYNETGSYTYKVKEVVTSDQDIHFDRTVYTVVVKVVDENATLKATATYSGGTATDKAAFTNTYIVDTDAKLEATKTVTSESVPDKKVDNNFSFMLLDANKTEITTVTNRGSSVVFEDLPELHYDKADTYTYYIKEDTTRAVDGYLYDTTMYKAVVNVTENKDHYLVATVEYFKVEGESEIAEKVDAAVFNNRYEETELKGTKTWNDQNNEFVVRPNSITLSVSDGATTKEYVPTSYEVDDADTNKFNWTLTGLPAYKNNHAVTYTVDEVQVNGYTVPVKTVDDEGKTHFTNTLDTFNITGNKTWTDGEDQDGIRPSSINIVLKRNGTEIGRETLYKTPAEGKKGYNDTWAFNNLAKYDAGNQPIIYTIVEETVTGYTTTYQLNDGEIKSGSIDVTYQEKVNAFVKITNEHTTDVTDIKVTKIWEGEKKMPEGIEVTLSPYASKDAKVTLSEENDWTYTWYNLPKKANGENIQYTVTETKEDEWTNFYVSGTPVKAVDDETIDFTITNTYVEPIPVPLEATKKLTGNGGKTLVADQFSFELSGGKLTEAKIAKNDAEGKVAFPSIEYTLGDLAGAVDNAKTFTYIIREIVPEEAKKEAGYTYSSDEYTAEVTITKNENNELTSSVQYYKGTDKQKEAVAAADVVFENKYNVNGTQVELVVTKTLLNNTALKSDDKRTFSFGLYEGDDTSKEPIKKIDLTFDNQTDKAQQATFEGLPELRYTAVGEHTYTVKEIFENEYGDIVYDKTVYTVTVDVTDIGGALKAETTYKKADGTSADSLDFENAYIAPTEVKLTAAKTFTSTDDSKTLNTEKFTFTLTGEGQEQSVTNDGGKVIFETIKYDASDLGDVDSKDFTYTIKETADNKDRYQYDTTVYTVIVTLTKNEEHQLNAAVKVVDGDGNDVGVDKIAFANKYATDDLSGTKTWNNEHCKFDTRPTEIKLDVYRYEANGTKNPEKDKKVKTISVTGDMDATSWAWSEKDLPGYVNNVEVDYYVVEQPVTGYKAEHADYASNLTNALDTFDIVGAKVWEDNEDQDGKRPETITITLKSGGEVIDTVVMAKEADAENDVLSWSNDWSFTGLPKLDKNGYDIQYTIQETINYKADTLKEDQDYNISYKLGAKDVTEDVVTITGETNEKVTVTNTRETEYTTITVTKKWLDGNNTAKRGAILVELLADGVHVDGDGITNPITLDNSNDWKITDQWKNLPVYKDGKKINYTVVELKTDPITKQPYEWTKDYQTSNVEKNGSSFTITNTLKTQVDVSKTWDDQNNKYGTQPESITVYLWQNKDKPKAGDTPLKSEILNAANGWKASFTDLLAYDNNGNAYDYTITEEPVTGYEGTVEDYVINNKLLTTSVEVTKEWVDNGDQDGVRPKAITLTLYADGKEVTRYTDEKVSVDNGKVTITADNAIEGNTNEWQYTFIDLPVYNEQGDKIKYTVKEDVTYTEGFEYTQANGGVATPEGAESQTLTNFYNVKTVDITVEKKWLGDEAYLGKRPKSVELELIKTIDGVSKETGKTVTLNISNQLESDENTWSTVAFNDLPMYEGGSEITYSVKETVTYEDGYAYSVTTDSATEGDQLTLTVTNTLEKIELPVTKEWKQDDDLVDETRPESITVYLWQNNDKPAEGDEPFAEMTLPDADGKWTASFTGLPMYKTSVAENGSYTKTENVYTVTEQVVPGYNTTIENGKITNTLKKIDIDVVKVWDVKNTGESIPTGDISVKLMQKAGENGTETVYRTGELTSENGWKTSFTGLPTHSKTGVEYIYSVEEVDVPTGYIVTGGTVVKEGDKYTAKLTNTIQLTELTVNKVWLNGEAEDGEATVQLVRSVGDEGATAYGDSVPLNKDNNWQYTFNDLPKYNAAGQEYSYTVKEAEVSDYSSNVSAVSNNKVTVTNTELTEVKVSKTWVNVVGKTLPGSIEVKLLANKVFTGKTVTLKPVEGSTKGEWTSATFENLPKYDADDEEIIYSVVEATKLGTGFSADVKDVKKVDDSNYEFEYEFEIVNTFTPGKTNLTVTKVWTDEENELNRRPGSITVKLMVTKSGKTTQYNNQSIDLPVEETGWTYTFENLPVEIDGEAVSYSVEEVLTDASKDQGYVLESNTVTGTNAVLTNKLELVEVKVEKIWEDDSNRDNVRPSSLSVTLNKVIPATADQEETTEAVGVAVKLNEQNKWTYTWENLPKFDRNGAEISYTVVEDVSNLTNGYEQAADSPEIVETEDGYFVTLTNTRDVDTFNVKGIKSWADNQNQDGVRPTSIKVELLVKQETPAENEGDEPVVEWVQAKDADGKPVEPAIVTGGMNADEWNWNFSNLPINEGYGRKLIYKVNEIITTEAGVYTTTYSVDEFSGNADGQDLTVTITNTHETDTVEIFVEKEWADSGNAAQVRPAEVTLELLKKIEGDTEYEATGDILKLSKSDADADNSDLWRSSFKNLPKYAEGGKSITYAVRESFIMENEAYTYVVTNDGSVNTEEENRTIQLTNKLELVDVEVVKEWIDQNNKYGSRPSNITITLLQNGKVYASKPANASENWKVAFKNLPAKDSNGKAYSYTVTETVDYTGLAYDYKESTAVEVTPEANSGIEIAYKLTNTLETTKLSGTKTWLNDSKNAYDTRKELQLTVKANGIVLKDGNDVAVTFPVTVPANLSADAKWTWTCPFDLPKTDAAGNDIVYTVEEAEIPGYENQTEPSAPNALKNELVLTKVVVTKVWEDNGNQDGKRPDKITLTLYADGKEVTGYTDESATVVGGKVTISAADAVDGNANKWQYTFTGLPKYRSELENEALALIVYTVKEEVVYETGFSYTNSNNGYAVAKADDPYSLTLTNTYDTKKVDVKVTKEWVSDGDMQTVRPDAIEAYLWKVNANGSKSAVVDPATNRQYKITLPKDGKWENTFTGLDKFVGGEEINYTVTETVTYKNNYFYCEDITEETVNNIILKNTLETVDIKVTKNWEGDVDHTGFRPEKIIVKLWQNEVGTGDAAPYATRDIIPGTAASNEVTFENMPKYNEDGKTKVEYFITEEVVYKADTVKYYYDSSISDNGKVVNNEATITNKLDTIDLEGKKIWVDESNAFNTRPEFITIQVKNGSEVVCEKDVKGDSDEWSWKVDKLPKYQLNADGEKIEITYTVVELPVKGYEGDVDPETIISTANTECVITNTLETISVSGVKNWNDSSNQDGKRPESITVNLLDEEGNPVTKKVLKDGVLTDETVQTTIDATDAVAGNSNQWNWFFTGLPKYIEGTNTVRSYTVSETIHYANGSDVEFQYTGKITVNEPDAAGNITAVIENSYAPKKTGVSLTKYWNDDGNRDAIRPESITIRVVGTIGSGDTEEVVFSQDYLVDNRDMLAGSWTWSTEADALDKFAKGQPVDYKLYEVGTIDGYTATNAAGVVINPVVSGDANLYEAEEGETNTFTITNKHEITLITVSGKKVWDDESDRDGIRPDVIILTLTSSDTSAEAVEPVKVEAKVGETDEWSYTFGQLPKYMVTLNQETNKLERVAIVYEVREDTAQLEGSDYVLSNTEDSIDKDTGDVTYIFTNKHEPAHTQISVKKVWDDDGNRDGKQATSIDVMLTAKVNDEVVDSLCQTKTLNADNQWAYTFDKLYVNYEGNAIEYSVDEVEVPTEYEKLQPIEKVTDENGCVTYTITNKHIVELVTIDVKKEWVDDNNRDGKQAPSVQVQLYKTVPTAEAGKTEDVAIGEPVTLSAANDWSFAFNAETFKAEPLYRYEKGAEIDYLVKEVTEINGYTTDIVEIENDTDNGKSFSYTVTNTHIPELTKVQITKVWDDKQNQDGKRKAVTFVLYANDVATEHEIQLTDADLKNDEWSYTFEYDDMFRYENGKDIIYTVKEKDVPAGYTEDYADTLVVKDEGAETVTTKAKITNKHEPEKTQVEVTKVWDDESNRDGMRKSITLQLYADKVAYGEPVTLDVSTAGDVWFHTFKNLDVYKNGQKIEYTVEETTKIEGYETTTVRNVIEPVEATETEPAVEGKTTVTITNKHEPVVTTVEGAKTWSDFDNQDGMRPVSITIKLMDGSTIVETKKVTEANGWKWSFTDLPKFRTGAVGEEIKYSIVEELDEASAAEYSITIDGYNVTNTHELETVEITGSKTWVDLNDKYLKRPDSVTIRLLADGVEIDSRKVTEADNWSWTFAGLPKFKAGEVGKEIVYTVQEDVVIGYITTVDDYNVTNSLNLVEFIKTDEQTGKRLPGAKFALYEGKVGSYDASKPVETWVSTTDTKILAGLKVGQTYTIVETEAPSGYAMMVPFQFTVQLSDIPGTYRAFSVSNCHVYRFRKLDSATNGLVHGAQLAIMDSGNNIIDSWWSSGDNNGWHEIVDSKLVAGVDYKLVELASPWGYELADPITFSIDENDGKLVINDSKSMGYDIVMYDEPWPEVTPTPEPTETSFTVTKRWEDKDNVLGLRPSNITVHLYRKLRTEAEYPTTPFMTVQMASNGKDTWRFTFDDLPRRSDDGVLYDYTVMEEPVEGYVVSYLNNGKTIVNSIPEEDFPPTPTPTLPYVTPTPSPMPRVPAGVQFVDGEWMYIDEYGIPLGGIPLTGDNTNFVLWGMAIGLPLLVAALAAVEIRRRKKLLLAAEDEEEVEETEA